MASTTRPKPSQRANQQKSGRRLPPKVKSGPDIPLLPLIVGGILVATAIVLIVVAVMNNKPAPPPPSADGITCDQLEHTQTHYHAALQIIHDGVQVNVPTDIGRLPNCFYWLHMHDESPGVIHIESPKDRTFTLEQFFAVWAASKGTPEPLDRQHVSTFTLAPDEKLYVYIDLNDGKGAQLFDGDPKTIVLKLHEVITLEITNGSPTPPPKFTFEAGL